MTERLTAALLVVTLLAVALPAEAAPLEYRPGKWKTKTTMELPGMPAQTRTTTECLRRGQYSPEDLMKDQEGCTVETPTVTHDTMRWTMACRYPHGTATGRGEFSLEQGGERGRGRIVITMKMQGQEVTNTMRLETERVGDCE
jgi:hypothetical protein